MDSNLGISYCQIYNSGVFVFRGDYDISRKPGVAKEIIKRRRKDKDLVLDFSKVEEFDTSCLASLVKVWKKVLKSGNNFYICGANDKLRGYCDTCSLYRFFDFYEGLSDFFKKEGSTKQIRQLAEIVYE